MNRTVIASLLCCVVIKQNKDALCCFIELIHALMNQWRYQFKMLKQGRGWIQEARSILGISIMNERYTI